MSDPATADANILVSHEQHGRVLSGMGADVEKLAETMDRHAPAESVTPPASPDPAAAPPDPAQPVSRGRQRFSDLTREREEARAEAAAAKAEREAIARERDELRQRLDQTARTAESTPPPAPAEPVAAQPTRPQPSEEEIGTKYKTYAEFLFDAAKWVVEQQQAAATPNYEQQVREALARERQRDQFNSAIQTAQERARKVYPDFDTLLKGPAGKIPLGPSQEEALERVAFIANHPQSEHIQYAILKDQALAEKLRASDAYTFGVTIAGLVPSSKPAAPAWTPPPAPHPTVGASSPTTAKTSSELTKGGFDFDKSGYREKRAAERGMNKSRW